MTKRWPHKRARPCSWVPPVVALRAKSWEPMSWAACCKTLNKNAKRRRCGNKPFNSSGATNPSSQKMSCYTNSTGWRILCCAAVRSTLAIMPVAAPTLSRRYASAKRWASNAANSPVCRAWGRSIFFFTTLRRQRRTIRRSWRWGAVWAIVCRKCRRKRGWRGSPVYGAITQQRAPYWNRASAPRPS